jgi:hypothetical protein
MQISPGITHPPSRLCLSDLRHGVPCKFRALTIMAALPRRAASYPLPVRQASALPSASSRFAVARDTLAVRLTLPLAGRVEDLHLLVSAPCRAHKSKYPHPKGAALINPPIGGTRPCPHRRQGSALCRNSLILNKAEVVPTASLSSPDSGHTSVSCPHPDPPYPHNTLLPKNDCPNTASSSTPGTG